MGLATLFVAAAWVFVILRVNPFEAGWLGLILFYIPFFGMLCGVFFLGQMAYNFWLSHEQALLIRQVRVSFRRAILGSIVSLVLLLLSAQNVLRWTWMLLILVIACAIEYVFLRLQSQRRA